MLIVRTLQATDAEGIPDWIAYAVLAGIVVLPVVVGLLWRAADRWRER